jgi:putative SOS response-associated peptidase YedK
VDATKSAYGSLLRPYPADAMTATAVSTYVNNAQHQGPECIAPAASTIGLEAILGQCPVRAW